MNNSTIKATLTPVALALAVILGMIIAPRDGRRANGQHVLPVNGSKLDYILGMIAHSYVDTVDVARLEEEVAIPALLQELDPHTVYIPARDMERARESIVGNFGGIGIQFYKFRDTVVVIKTVPGGPSEAAGIRDGDRVTRVDDSIVAGRNMPTDRIMGMMRGETGTGVRLEIHRAGERDPVVKHLTRGTIPVKSVDVAFMPDDTTAYVKISTFSMTTAAELERALARLQANATIARLVIDLRGNEGGILPVALQVLNEFLDADRLMLYTLGQASPRKEYRSTGRGKYKTPRLVVLVDELSASASEIFAGAIQDNDRGVIVGRRTFGKGLVQEQRVLPDGSALRLTVARYYIPSGRSIQKSYEEGKEKYYSDILARLYHGEFFEQDSTVFDENLKYTTLGGRPVYGGGGIMPDLFVPADTAGNTRYASDVIRSNILYEFTIDFMDRHRPELATITNVDDLLARLQRHDLVNDLATYAATRGLPRDEAALRSSRALLDNRLKAHVARHVMDDDGFYPVLLRLDETFRRALAPVEVDEKVLPSRQI